MNYLVLLVQRASAHLRGAKSVIGGSPGEGISCESAGDKKGVALLGRTHSAVKRNRNNRMSSEIDMNHTIVDRCLLALWGSLTAFGR